MNGSYYQVSDLKESIRGILTGLNLTNVRDLNGKLQRAATTLLMKADVGEMTDRSTIYLYDGVFDYAPVSTIFGSLILDARPQGITRDSRLDKPYKKPLQDFDLMKQRLSNGVLITFEQRGMQQIVRLAQTRADALAMIDPMSQTDDWAVGGNASGLAQDLTMYYDNPASLRFNLAAGGTQGYIEKTFSTQSDFSRFEGVGVAFLAVSLPSASAITSIGMHLGNSSGNYWNVSDTEGFLGAWIANDWLLVALDLAAATTTGTVDPATIDYVRLYFNYTSASILANVRVGGLWLSLPSPYELIFETPAIFVPDTSTTRQKTVTNDNDTIILGDAAYHIYAYECAREIALGKGGSIANGLIAGIDLVLEGGPKKLGLYQKYRGDNPSQTLKSIGNYYSFPR